MMEGVWISNTPDVIHLIEKARYFAFLMSSRRKVYKERKTLEKGLLLNLIRVVFDARRIVQTKVTQQGSIFTSAIWRNQALVCSPFVLKIGLPILHELAFPSAFCSFPYKKQFAIPKVFSTVFIFTCRYLPDMYS